MCLTVYQHIVVRFELIFEFVFMFHSWKSENLEEKKHKSQNFVWTLHMRPRLRFPPNPPSGRQRKHPDWSTDWELRE